MSILIAVIGGRKASSELLNMAHEVGILIAQHGAILLCGGLTGIMEAAARGAVMANGVTVGLLPGESKTEANPYIQVPIATGLGLARNAIITKAADAVIAIGGAYGTLSEIAFSLQFDKKVVGLNTWDIEGVVKATTAQEAVSLALNRIKTKT